ncbi:unnamed protein product [Dibothriocephalus latus]|uniref:Uncharacterized protein n=1 Tax=Dibothriocephalus latus TaxID=60516 RepID=A0A3P7LNM1_DIBLA|nr:unnamed protein product [Dibothriocephalus latus]
MCGMRRAVFTQERGPFIFTTLLPGVPSRVIVNSKQCEVNAVKGICWVQNSTEAFKCNVERFGEFARFTIFLADVENVQRILIGVPNTDLPDRIDWISVERESFASSERVLKDEDQYSILKFTLTRGVKPIVIFTCIYDDAVADAYEVVSYRYLWPGFDAFDGEDEVVHTTSNIVKFQWTVRSWGPLDYRKMECSLTSGDSSTSINIDFENDIRAKGDRFRYRFSYMRFGQEDKTVFVCNSADDKQTQTIYWHRMEFEGFNGIIPDFPFPVEGTALSKMLRDYLMAARARDSNNTQVTAISTSATLRTICFIGVNKLLWSCTVHFENGKMQILVHQVSYF